MTQVVQDFLDGFLCSEAVVKNFSKDKTLLKTATGFGAGVAYGNSLCGALSGGFLMLSSQQGRDAKEQSVEKLFANITELKQSFEKEFGSCECSTLLGFNLSDSDGGKKFEAQDCKNQKCAKFIDFVTQTTSELLNK